MNESIYHEDERVVSLVVRLLGHIIGIDRESSAIFDLVLNEHASLLNFVFGQLESSKVDEIPAALKFGIIESIGSIVKSNRAFNWIRLNQPCLQQLCDSLNDTNLFVRSLLNLNANKLDEFDIVLGKLYSMFDTKENYCNALELLWNLSEIKMTEIHIINEKLVDMCFSLSIDSDRFIQQKSLNILENMMANGTASFLNINFSNINASETKTTIEERINNILNKYIIPSLSTINVPNFIRILGLLKLLTKIAHDFSCDEILLEFCLTIRNFFNIVLCEMDDHIEFKSPLLKVNSSLQNLKTHVKELPEQILTIQTGTFLNELVTICGYCLSNFKQPNLVKPLLKCCSKFQKNQKLTQRIIQCLRDGTILHEYENDLVFGIVYDVCSSNARISVPCVKASLELLLILAKDNKDRAIKLMQLVQVVSVHPGWDYRDISIQFLVDIDFKTHAAFLQNIEHLKVMKLAIDRLEDEEAYVRSSALLCLKLILKYQLNKILCCMLEDKEPVVLSSLLDLMVAVPIHWQTLLGNQSHHYINTKFLNHEDSQVRIKSLEFIKEIHNHAGIIDAFEIELISIIEMLEDPSRTVRITAIDVVHSLYQYIQQNVNAYGEQGIEFTQKYNAIDFELMKLKVMPEHLYQEALDMDDSIMIESENRGEGNNVLFCYDC
ncbi:hypothetical protein HDV02_006583 [Globomyces sp. JEL0801]|nr:hypothetical protein HDV02_006583 [Globomyces sp. JEL0801]